MNNLHVLSRRSVAPRIPLVSRTYSSKESQDVFGTLSKTGTDHLAVSQVEKYYPDDGKYGRFDYDLTPRKNAFYYKYEIKDYARQGASGLNKALELFHQMKKDRLEPSMDNYFPLIYGCAKAGYTKKAFELYEEMLKCTEKPPHSIITCLINACAESPFPEYGLERLKWFIRHIQVNYNYSMNYIQYAAAVKAYGKLGKLDEAVALVKQMCENGLRPGLETFEMLFVGCASNKESGTTLALRIFKRMRYFGIPPSTKIYNNMLRVIRDCKMGDPELVKETLRELPSLTSFEKRIKYKKLTQRSRKIKGDISSEFEWLPAVTDLSAYLESALKFKKCDDNQKLIEGKKNKGNNELTLLTKGQSTLVPNIFCDSKDLPNLLSDEHLEIITRVESIDIGKLDSSIGRLSLFGGMYGYLKLMAENNCKPDIKTFTLMLCSLPYHSSVQLEIFRLTSEYSVARDVGFYDFLIRHVADNAEPCLDLARYFIEQLHIDGLRPNISTFESLARCCKTLDDAKQLISDIRRAGFHITQTLFMILVGKSMETFDFEYANFVIEECLKHGVNPTRKMVDVIESKKHNAKITIDKQYKGTLDIHGRPFWFTEDKMAHFGKFNKLTNDWFNQSNLADEEHPWSQFEIIA